ncbi:MAG: DNA primase TraC [Legionella sp.]|uniref:toprim domain-containing protein n=1 Tax=Legionella sp. TaxID=459 RepID=UPI003D14BD60
MDKNGDIWTMQYIREDGTKRFAKDSRKEGCFHVVGGFENLSQAPAIIITEGYATAATIKQALEFPIVCGFDSGNLIAVAQGLKERFPDKAIIIAGDDDKHLENTNSNRKPCNPGKEKALEAASSVDGHAIFPIFAPNEQQVNPRKFSDFNDLAQNSHLGFEGVKRQIKPVVKKIIQKQQGIKQTTAKTLVQPV